MIEKEIEDLVVDDIKHRAIMGRKKYGVTVAQSPLTEEQWLQHAYEEALDLAIYLKRIMTMKASNATDH